MAWKIVKEPDSLLAKVYKSKYFPNCHFEAAARGIRPSFIWKGLVEARQILLYGSRINGEEGNRSWSEGNDFSVRSAYKVAKSLLFNSAVVKGEQSDMKKIQMFWRRLWSLPLPTKIKLFSWKAYHGGLQCGAELMRRHITKTCDCLRCGCELETASHLFFECWWSVCFWNMLGFNMFQNCWRNLNMADWLFVSSDMFNEKEYCLLICGAWTIWYVRNSIKFSGGVWNVEDAVWKCKMIFNDFICNVYIDESVQNWSFRWQKPGFDILKVNVDASWDNREMDAGLAIVVRDHEGIVPGTYVKYMARCRSALDAEGEALYAAMEFMHKYFSSQCIIEVDCVTAALMVKGLANRYNASTSDWCKKGRNLLSIHDDRRLLVIRREANSFADALAKETRKLKCNWDLYNACPRFMQDIIVVHL